MKNIKLSQNGITMISLVVTILILLLLSTITMNIGIENYNQTIIRNYVSQMKVIQSRVDILAEKNSIDYNKKLDSLENTNPEEYEIFINLIDVSEKENWYYFTPQDLETELSLKDQELTVIINFETREVISKKSVKKDGVEYHMQYGLPGGDTLYNKE